MRMMLKFRLSAAAVNQATPTSRIGEVLGSVLQGLQPEAMYFLVEDGQRTGHVYFDLKDPAVIPVIAEPLFQNLDARVHLVPVMTLDELQRGIAESAQG